jgi:SAM-dependent methyltransferase
MSRPAVALFSWLQDADFYRDMHATAADLLPSGARRLWLDIGCGPGLLARIAAEKGYAARGVDPDAGMIEQARRLATARQMAVTFDVANIQSAIEARERFDVVSASSLLVVLPDPAKALRQLISLTKPNGVVLIIEASKQMSRRRALSLALFGGLGRRSYMLPLWAMARSGRTLPDSTFELPDLHVRRHLLLGGLADAWLLAKVP